MKALRLVLPFFGIFALVACETVEITGQVQLTQAVTERGLGRAQTIPAGRYTLSVTNKVDSGEWILPGLFNSLSVNLRAENGSVYKLKGKAAFADLERGRGWWPARKTGLPFDLSMTLKSSSASGPVVSGTYTCSDYAGTNRECSSSTERRCTDSFGQRDSFSENPGVPPASNVTCNDVIRETCQDVPQYSERYVKTLGRHVTRTTWSEGSVYLPGTQTKIGRVSDLDRRVKKSFEPIENPCR